MQETQKKKETKRGLSRKQFLLGLITVCGVAIIIEAALLIRMFTKKTKKENPTPTPTGTVTEEVKPTATPEPTPTGEAWGYTKRSYDVLGDERRVMRVETHDYDMAGREEHRYIWEDSTSFLGHLTEEDYVFTYDENGRILSEKKEIRNGQGAVTDVFTTEYTYYEGEQLTVFMKTHNAAGTVTESGKSTYDDQGRLLRREYYYANGETRSSETRRYDDYGNLIERTLSGDYDIDKELIITYDEKERKSERIDYYLGTFSKEVWFYDGQGRPAKIESYYEGKMTDKALFYYDGDERICRKRAEYDGEGKLAAEYEYDEKGLIISQKWWIDGVLEDWYDWEFTWEAEDEPLTEYYRVTERWKSGPEFRYLAYPYQYEISEFTPISCFDRRSTALGGVYVSTEDVWELMKVDSVSNDGAGNVSVISWGDRYVFDEHRRLVLIEDTIDSETGEQWVYEYTYY